MSTRKKPVPAPGFVAESARQEGASGRLGRGSGDTLSNGAIDNSDPNNLPVDADGSRNRKRPPGRERP